MVEVNCFSEGNGFIPGDGYGVDNLQTYLFVKAIWVYHLCKWIFFHKQFKQGAPTLCVWGLIGFAISRGLKFTLGWSGVSPIIIRTLLIAAIRVRIRRHVLQVPQSLELWRSEHRHYPEYFCRL